MTPIRTLRPLAKVVLGTQSDERLVTLSRGGSEDAFAEIVRRHRPGLLRLARSLGSGDRADDVVQDGLVRAWRALQRTDAEIDLRPWLTTIVRNRALTAHTTTRIHEELDETIDGVRQPGDIVIMREELRSAVSAVNSLPDTQREALVRSALSGESHDQIASALATTPGAVRQLIFRARTGLREAVGALVPYPLVRSLAEISTGGAAAGGTAVALAGGGALGLKALSVVVIGVAVTGSGIAIERHASGDKPQAVKEVAATTTQPATETQPQAEPATEGDTADAADVEEVAASASAAPERSQDLVLTEGNRSSSTRVADAPADETSADDSSAAAAPPAQQGQAPQQPPPNGGGTNEPRHPGGGGQHPGEQPAPAPPQTGGQQQPPPSDQPPPPDGDGHDGQPGGDHDGPPPDQDGQHDGAPGGQMPTSGSNGLAGVPLP